jgi:hypothetical protein
MIKLVVPASIQHYEDQLESFLLGMIHKLDLNSDKDTPTTETISSILGLLFQEITEYRMEKNKKRRLVELMDVANFAFLLYLAERHNDSI